jgi:hypothetical protein
MNKLLLTTAFTCFVPFALAQKAQQQPAPAIATAPTIYKLVDDNGRVTYSNLPMKGATKIELDPVMVMPLAPPPARLAGAVKVSMVSSLPSIDGVTQKKRDDVRRRILEDEIRAEDKLLGEARTSLNDETGNRDIIRMMRAAAEKQTASANIEARRAYDHREEKLRLMQEAVATHEQNIEAIKKELAALK